MAQPKNKYSVWVVEYSPKRQVPHIRKAADVWGYDDAFWIAVWLSASKNLTSYVFAEDGRLLHKIPRGV